MELDPFARPWVLSLALIQTRQFDAALNEARLRSQAQPDNAAMHDILAAAYWHKGMEREAAQEWETSAQLASKKEPDKVCFVERAGQPPCFQVGEVRITFTVLIQPCCNANASM